MISLQSKELSRVIVYNIVIHSIERLYSICSYYKILTTFFVV